MQGDILESTLRELELMFEPLSLAATEPEYIVVLLRRLGWSIDDLLPALSGLTAGFGGIKAALTEIRTIADGGAVDLPLISQALSLTAGIPAAVRALEQQLIGTLPEMAADLGGLASELLVLLFTDWLRHRSKLTYAALAAAGVIVETVTTEKRGVQNRMLRRAVVLDRMHLDAIPDWFSNPSKQASAQFGFAGITDEAAARAYAARLFPLLALIGTAIGATPRIGRGGPLRRLGDDDEQALAYMLSLQWSTPLDDGEEAVLGFNLAALSAAEDGPGLVLMPYGNAAMDFTAGGWSGTAKLDGSIPWVLLMADGVTLGDGGAGGWDASLVVKRPGAQYRIGGVSGTRLELGDLSVDAQLKLGATLRDIALGLTANHAKLVIAAGDGDGFLAKVLPTKGVDVDFDIGMLWSLSTGLRLKGSTEMDAVLPLDLDFGGVLFLDSLAIHVAALTEGGLPRFEASLGLSLNLTLGPLSATVDRVGIQLDISAPLEGGNAGPVHARIAFKPPTGIGIAVDATAVSGGGFLSLDYERQQYSGVLELSIQNTIDVKAIGILNARLPDGRPGFSLLLIVTGDFPPLQLGMGFTLNGIGGLLGINRTAAVDQLRTGLHTGSLDAILFPPDPLSNVPALLSTLGSVFPVAEGRYVFGPMAKFGWGSPTILTLDLALILEIPDPVRLLVLGRLKATLPSEANAVVLLHMDALGVLDFSRSEFSLDATLYDSRILTFKLSGDMAMRLSWGAQPSFLFSVGGFHPSFQPPAVMPKLARLAIVFVDNAEVRLRLDSYFALTSNTVQFGARAEAYLKLGVVEANGFVSFDALFHFSPFTLEAELAAMVAIKVGGVVLLGADLALTLTGPTPWHVFGVARFVVLGIKGTANVKLRIGADHPPPERLPDPVDVFAMLTAAFKDRRNWQTQLPDSSTFAVSLRPALADEASAQGPLLVHPLGTISVRQRVVPLLRVVSRYGNAPLQGASFFSAHFELIDRGDARRPAAPLASEPLLEQFAPAQYENLSDARKLAGPSFTAEAAGLRIDDAAFASSPGISIAPLDAFEDLLQATPALRHLGDAAQPSMASERLARFISLGAAANAASRTTGRGRYFAISTPAKEAAAHG